MTTYRVFIAGASFQYHEMLKLAEYQKTCLKHSQPESNVITMIAETTEKGLLNNTIEKNFKSIAESDLVLILRRNDKTVDKDTAYLMKFAEHLGKNTIEVDANFFAK